MTFFRREGENPMKHFGSYLTIAGTVPYVMYMYLLHTQRTQFEIYFLQLEKKTKSSVAV